MKNKDEQLNYGLGYSTSSNFTTNLFVGPSYDQFQMSIYVQVYDKDGAFTTYEIVGSITVLPDASNLFIAMNDLISANPYFSTNIILNQGSYLNSLEEIQRISSLFNIKSQSDKLSIINYGDKRLTELAFPQIYGPSAEYVGVEMVDDLIIVVFKIKIAQFYYINI